MSSLRKQIRRSSDWLRDLLSAFRPGTFDVAACDRAARREERWWGNLCDHKPAAVIAQENRSQIEHDQGAALVAARKVEHRFVWGAVTMRSRPSAILKVLA